MTTLAHRSLLNIAETLGTRLTVVRQLGSEHPDVPLPDSLLLPLGDVSPIDRMTRLGISHDDAQDYLEGLRDELATEEQTAYTLSSLIENIGHLVFNARQMVATLPKRYQNQVLPEDGDLPF